MLGQASHRKPAVVGLSRRVSANSALPKPAAPDQWRRAPNLRRMLRRCASTVRGLTLSIRAISLVRTQISAARVLLAGSTATAMRHETTSRRLRETKAKLAPYHGWRRLCIMPRRRAPPPHVTALAIARTALTMSHQLAACFFFIIERRSRSNVKVASRLCHPRP